MKNWFKELAELVKAPPGPIDRRGHRAPVYEGPIRTEINFPAYPEPERESVPRLPDRGTAG